MSCLFEGIDEYFAHLGKEKSEEIKKHLAEKVFYTAIEEIYLFPDKNAIRFIYISENEGRLTRNLNLYWALYIFCGLDQELAYLNPEDKDIVIIPEEWGGWENAKLIYEKKEILEVEDFKLIMASVVKEGGCPMQESIPARSEARVLPADEPDPDRKKLGWGMYENRDAFCRDIGLYDSLDEMFGEDWDRDLLLSHLGEHGLKSILKKEAFTEEDFGTMITCKKMEGICEESLRKVLKKE